MYVSQISLSDFRSYTQLDLVLEPGVSAFVGPNGHGKTNLIEAIAYAANLSSHRVTSDAALVRSGARRAIIRVAAVRAGRSTLVELEINPGQANRAQVNRSPVRRSRDVLGILRTVVFAPEDLSLVKGDPDGRRRFLDQLLVQLTPRMAGVLADHERVLRQRSALLKSAGYTGRSGLRGRGGPRGVGGEGGVGGELDAEGAKGRVGGEGELGGKVDAKGGPADLRTLDVWDAKLAELGAQVLAARTRLVEQLRPHVELAYRQVSDGGEAGIGYRSSLQSRFDENTGPMDPAPVEVAAGESAMEIPHLGVPVERLEAELVSAMGRLRRKEIERGVTLVGPHRDDVVLRLGGLPARGYASHGESWSLALALRLASYHLLTHGMEGADGIAGWAEGSEPVLVLDDVFAELDTDRRGRLANLVKGAEQVLITAAAANDVPEELVGSRFEVMGGQVNRVP